MRHGIYSPGPVEDKDKKFEEVLKELRDRGCVPIGILSFDMNEEEVILSLVEGVEVGEVNALLAKIKLKGIF
jgi:hypothetical protein